MNTDIVKHILEVLKLAPKYLVAIGLVLAILLFAPTHWLQSIGIADIAKDYRTGIGIGFLASCALFVVSVGQLLLNGIRVLIGNWQFKRYVRQRLGRLTEDEKQILRFYIAKQTRTNSLRFDDGVVQGLAGKRIIYQSSSMGSMLHGFAYNINEVAWDVLNEDPTLLNGVTDTYRTDKVNYKW